MGGCRCSSGRAPGARPVVGAGTGVGCVAGEAGEGAMVDGAAIVDVGSNRAVAASTDDSALV